MSKTKKNKVVEPELENVKEETVATPVVEEDTSEDIEKEPSYFGKIRDCEKLNVREKPAADAKILCMIDTKATVIVDKSESTKDYYKVCLESGVHGYCMKKYMSVKKQEV